MGLGPKPSTYLDLEQLQIADYSAFEGVSEEQRQFIADSIHGSRSGPRK